MPVCPECGGEMIKERSTPYYVCHSCGLTLSRTELREMLQEYRKKIKTEEELREEEKKKVLKWLLSPKKGE